MQVGQRRHVLLSEVEGKPAICFDTGLEPRSFARTKMSQSLVEKGYIVHPDGSHEVWTSSGVCEYENHMRVWGKPLSGERLDIVLSNIDTSPSLSQTALNAIVFWIKAKLFLGDTNSAYNPAAAFIGADGNVFFSPPNLANRCLYAEGLENDPYNCPDLTGTDAAAFCAGAMLYKILIKELPYKNANTMYQDMREGVFLPPHIASPALNKEICELIHSALLLPVEKKTRMHEQKRNSVDILNSMLIILSENKIISSLFADLSDDENTRNVKNKKAYAFRQKNTVAIKRFTARNKLPIIIFSGVALFLIFIIFSMTNSYKNRPTTAGMYPDSVVYTYYNAYSSLDHALMEACTQGSDSVIKNDINSAATFYAIAKTRQSYEYTTQSPIIPARVWVDNGGELPAPDVFGVTDLTLQHLAGSENDGMMIYRVNYLLWAPSEYARTRTDTLTLRKDRRKNWRITEIIRAER